MDDRAPPWHRERKCGALLLTHSTMPPPAERRRSLRSWCRRSACECNGDEQSRTATELATRTQRDGLYDLVGVTSVASGSDYDDKDRFVDHAAGIQIDAATTPDNGRLLAELDAHISAAGPKSEYDVLAMDQYGALSLLEELGAWDEIKFSLIGHACATAPTPTYKPQALKRLLRKRGWIPEVRVPPYSTEHDQLPVNDRFDLYKVFDYRKSKVGIAIEIERWEVWQDLLKFYRGHHRGQIAAGVILQDNPANLKYVFNHLRLLSGPLFEHLPIVFAAPIGPGLPESHPPTKQTYAAFLMP